MYTLNYLFLLQDFYEYSCSILRNSETYLVCPQLFLTLCTLVTLYYAKEVPLTQKQVHHISDSAPLLDDPQQNGFDLSKSKTDEQSVDNASEKRSGGGYEAVSNLKHENGNVEGDQVESFNDSPGAVLVNLLTSLRHLPPAMHSVLIVMALTWVRATFLCMANIISELYCSCQSAISSFIDIHFVLF